MRISAEFVISAASAAQLPADELPQIALCGRSNVGKSSLINTLVNRKNLARTSNTPGKTRQLNFYRVNLATEIHEHSFYFVDLPGYGYAKVARSERASWRPLIEAYLSDRQPLRALVLLIDARRGAENEEIELIEWLRASSVQTIPVLTKIDKLPKNKRKPAAFAQQKALSSRRPPLLVSAQNGDGLDQLWQAVIRAAAGPGSP